VPKFYCPRVLSFPRGTHDRFCFLQRLNPFPFVGGRVRFVGEGVGEPEQIRPAILRIPASTAFSNLYEAQSFCFSNRWRDRAMMDSILAEVLVCDWQLSILLASMMTKLKLDP
jgi:hypothetical protein